MDLSPPPALGDRVNTVEPLTYSRGNTATGGVWRVHGPAGQAILKVARPPSGRPGADDPAGWNYWKREALAYRTGLVTRVYADSGIVVPELLRVEDRPDGTIALWLSEATGTPGRDWTVERLAAFSRQLGAAQARWVGRVPHWPWLSRRWLAGYLAARPVLPPAELPWDQPAGAAAWPEPLRRAARALWTDRDALVTASEKAPRTLCHLDVWPMNLVDDGARTVLLDWAFAGEGGLGEDLANLVVESVRFGLMDVALLPEITRECTEGYLAGLRAGGWTGPADVIRRAVAASGAAKFSWLAPAMLLSASRGEPLTHPAYGVEEPPEETFRRRRPLLELLTSWYESVA
jgi:hypothetical protein